jgi:hypothetical protein
MWRRATSTTPLLACRIAGSLIPVGSAIARLDIPLRKKVVRRMHGVFFGRAGLRNLLPNLSVASGSYHFSGSDMPARTAEDLSLVRTALSLSRSAHIPSILASIRSSRA